MWPRAISVRAWVVSVDRVTTAVWSKGQCVQMLVPDRRLWRGPVEIYYRYFTQIDATWLYERLAAGAHANKSELDKVTTRSGVAKRARSSGASRRSKGG